MRYNLDVTRISLRSRAGAVACAKKRGGGGGGGGGGCLT